MKNIVEKINESLYTPGTGFDECDGLTREYNNLFGMISNTLLRKVNTTIVDRPVYVLTGSILRTGYYFLYNKDLAVTALGETMTPGEFLNDRGYCIYDIDGSNCCCDGGMCEPAEDSLDPIILSAVNDMVSDEDYLIIA